MWWMKTIIRWAVSSSSDSSFQMQFPPISFLGDFFDNIMQVPPNLFSDNQVDAST